MLIGQLSDTHVRPNGVLYQGVVDSNRMLAEAIEQLQQLDRRPDLVLLTGDLVDEGLPEEYAAIRALLEQLTVPYLVIPGNHDHRENFRAAFADHTYIARQGPLHFCVDRYPLRIIGLDSCVPGLHHGHIDAESLAWLSGVLEADPVKPTLIMMHHPPFASGIPYMDEYRCMDSAPLEALIARFSNVELVLCGHVHRSMLRRWANTVICSCPSTVTEIHLQLQASAAPQSHLGPRGGMLHCWDATHGVLSHTLQFGRFDGPYPFA